MRYFLTHPQVALAGIWTLARFAAIYTWTLARRAARRAKGGDA